jgi:hypothetical protein
MNTVVLGTRPVVMLSWLVHACLFWPVLFPDALLTAHPAQLCSRLHRLNATHLLHPRGTLGQEHGNHSFKSYQAARPGTLPAGAGTAPLRAPHRPWALAGARAARAANLRLKVVLYRPQSQGRPCSQSTCAVMDHLRLKMRSQAVDVGIAMKIGYKTFQSSCVRKISNSRNTWNLKIKQFTWIQEILSVGVLIKFIQATAGPLDKVLNPVEDYAPERSNKFELIEKIHFATMELLYA